MTDSGKNPVSHNSLLAWQETKVGLVFIVLFDLFLTYIIASLAIDSGSLLQYFAALVFLALAIGQAVKLVKKVVRHER
jgi:hypothetical protein